MSYKEKETPLIYGIMYSETMGDMPEIVFYENKDERDFAMEYLKEHGTLEIERPWADLGKTINPHVFNAVEASKNYYIMDYTINQME